MPEYSTCIAHEFNSLERGTDMKTELQLTIDAMRVELRRRLADRNTKGYWGVNARAWAHKLVRDIRKLEGE